jgi:nucleoside 2-deoxyribosyltransferase
MPNKSRIYCAGPLFNNAERQEMALIAQQLEESGYETFLPQRDGIEFSKLNQLLLQKGLVAMDANHLLARAIFCLDVFQLLEATHAVVVNLNGRVPDEGTMVEAALAWHAAKPVVLYKSDSRSLLNGEDNPMVTGLGGFNIISDLALLPGAVKAALGKNHKKNLREALAAGQRMTRIRKATRDNQLFAEKLLTLFQRSAPNESLQR